jgi:hypothetical protein
VAQRKVGSPQIPVAIVVADVLDRTGRVGPVETGYVARVAELSQCCEWLKDAHGGELMVMALRSVAATHGYQLIPDIKLVREHGKCQAYHELVGNIWDGVTANGREPSMAEFLETLAAVRTLHQELGNDDDSED